MVPIYVPYLIGMDVLHEFSLGIYFHSNRLTFKQQKWKLPIEFKIGHAYVLYKNQIFSSSLTRSELIYMHKHLIHPSQVNIYNLPKRAKFEQVSLKLSNNRTNCSIVWSLLYMLRSTIPVPRNNTKRRNRMKQVNCNWSHIYEHTKIVLHVVFKTLVS